MFAPVCEAWAYRFSVIIMLECPIIYCRFFGFMFFCANRVQNVCLKKELLVRVGVFVVAGRAEQDALAGVYRQHQYACHQDNDDGGGEDQRRAE